MKFFGLYSTADSEVNTWIAARFEINEYRTGIFPFIEIKAWNNQAELLNLISWVHQQVLETGQKGEMRSISNIVISLTGLLEAAVLKKTAKFKRNML